MLICFLLYQKNIRKRDISLLRFYKKKLCINLKIRQFFNKITKKMVNKLNILLKENSFIEV